MKIIKSKKAMLHYIRHPVFMVTVAFLLGALVMYLVAIGIIPTPIKICP